MNICVLVEWLACYLYNVGNNRRFLFKGIRSWAKDGWLEWKAYKRWVALKKAESVCVCREINNLWTFILLPFLLKDTWSRSSLPFLLNTSSKFLQWVRRRGEPGKHKTLWEERLLERVIFELHKQRYRWQRQPLNLSVSVASKEELIHPKNSSDQARGGKIKG